MSTHCKTRSNALASASRAVQHLDPGDPVELTLPSPSPPPPPARHWEGAARGRQRPSPACGGRARPGRAQPRAWSWSARVAPPPPSACRGSARAAVSRTIDHRKTRLINSKLGLKRREMGKEGGAEYSHFCPGHLSFIPLPSSAVECHIWQAGSSGNLGAAVGWASCPRAGRVASRAL